MTYVDPFLGAGAVWLALLGADLVPPVSWMGGKRRLAEEILAILGLRLGRPIPCILGDASWWGWVWPLCLDSVTGPQVCAWLRSWRGEDPRALWFRLRGAGPPEDLVERAAGLLWLQARAASGVPVWWEGDEVLAAPGDGRERQRAADRGANGLRRVVSMDGHGRGPYPAWQATCTPALVQHASTKIDQAGQRQATEPRLVATTHGNGQPPGAPYDAGCKGGALIQMANGRGVPREAGHTADKSGEDGRTGGIVDPGTIAHRLDAIRARIVKASGGEAGIGDDDGVRRGKGWRAFEPGDVATRLDAIRAASRLATVLHTDARALTEEWAPRLGASGLWYLDPPYQARTGYPVTCSRDEVLAIAELPARHGGRVVVSEAVGLAADLGRGWSQMQLRRGKKQEWVTAYGCDVRAHLPPILRMCS